MRAARRVVRLHGVAAVSSIARGRAQPTLSLIRGRGLSVRLEQFLHRLHDRRLRILKTIISELFRIREEPLGVERRITAFSVVIAAKPDGDVLRIGNFMAGVLTAGNFCDVQRDLRPRRRNGLQRQ